MEAMDYCSFPKRTEEDIKLCDKGIDEESPSYCAPSVASDESHQKTEAYQHHDVDILKSWISLRIQSSARAQINSHKYPN